MKFPARSDSSSEYSESPREVILDREYWLADAWSFAIATLSSGLAALPASARIAWLAFRTLAAVITVPIAEELAFQGLLIRRLIPADFNLLDSRHYTYTAILISSLAFGLMHGERWLAGTIAGLLYAIVLLRPGRIGDAVIAHATTNAALAGWVLLRSDWVFGEVYCRKTSATSRLTLATGAYVDWMERHSSGSPSRRRSCGLRAYRMSLGRDFCGRAGAGWRAGRCRSRVSLFALILYVAPPMRVRTRRSGHRYAADSGLPGPSQYSAHGPIYREQSGVVRNVVEVSNETSECVSCRPPPGRVQAQNQNDRGDDLISE